MEFVQRVIKKKIINKQKMEKEVYVVKKIQIVNIKIIVKRKKIKNLVVKRKIVVITHHILIKISHVVVH